MCVFERAKFVLAKPPPATIIGCDRARGFKRPGEISGDPFNLYARRGDRLGRVPTSGFLADSSPPRTISFDRQYDPRSLLGLLRFMCALYLCTVPTFCLPTRLSKINPRSPVIYYY